MTAVGNATVVGGGTMGLGIAYSLWSSGYRVELVEVDYSRHGTIRETLANIRDGAISRGKLNLDGVVPLDEGIVLVSSIGETAASPTVAVEAVPEIPDLKHAVLREMQALRPGLLGSNTSSISIDSLAGALDDPSALIGIHFFNPVWVNVLVEIVVGDRTRDEALDRAKALVENLHKESVIVRDRPGFASSRLGVLLGLEAIRMVEEGVASAADIDRAMELGYRHPMGPLKLTDLVGLDVRLAITANLEEAYGDRFAAPGLLKQMVAEGRLGKKAGQGFYDWASNSGT